jgi:hypothetical protein
MAQTIGASVASTLSNVLKDVYTGTVVEQLNNEVLLTQRLERDTVDFSGNQLVYSVHKERSAGVFARGENVAFAQAGAQKYAKPVYDVKSLYGRIRVTGLGRVKTAKDAGSFLRVLESEISGIKNDLKMDLARQLYGTGDSIIAGGSASASTTVTLRDTGAGTTTTSEALRKGEIYIGMRLDVGTLANPTVQATGLEVTGFSIANSTITVSAAVTVTAGTHFLFREGNAAPSSVSYEVSGLQQVVSTTANTFGGINAASAGNEYWDNQRINAAGALSLDILTQAFNTVMVAGGDVSAMIASPGSQRALFNLLQSQVRYTDPLNLKGGFKAIDYMGQPFIADRQAPFGKIFFLDEKYLNVLDAGDWDWLNEDGNILKWVTGFDAWEAVLARYMNISAKRRNTQLVLHGLTSDPNGI